MGKKLLVADDSLTIQKVIKLALSSEGYDILAVSEGKEAIRAIQDEKPDVVLIDVALPGSDAYEVKSAINAVSALASTSFILMSSAFERVDEKRVDEVRFQGRLIKPFDPSHLRKSVGELMKKAPAAPVTAAVTSAAEKDDDLPPVRDSLPLMTEEDFAKEEDTPPPPPPQQEEEENLENDIRDLTESTIKMSGLDEFQWNLDDSKKMKAAPTPAPAAERTREIQASHIKPMISLPSKPIDDGGTNFPLNSTTTTQTQNQFTRAEIEQMIRKDVEAAVEKLAREAVPQIAEAMIRREIEKILAES